ncbi:CPBP family intramembrane glutamic endopeptidase [Anaerocolumna sp. AGMB13020]|uniref:CPBP family intramembrane glutamic endopeptidase n=1 Tax=Anaerocolumna sp. AGMB13020 TaxID=3081750 RepID=UPI002952A9ED|nr:CPBP family intramembrane glutamic endopeptidase [Anaerocolumna sp. AGMB13020]WOO36035.1 CPBP family intramembrane glutamic endopeptidase [Anaerocolumna sp. AGMB13020]
MLSRIRQFFSVDSDYKKSTSQYTKTDGTIAVIFYLMLMLSYYGMGRIYVERKMYLGIICNSILIVICIGLVFIRGQKVSSLGLSYKKLKQSLLLGLVLGLFMILANNIIPGIAGGSHFAQISKILYNIFYYFVIIAFMEELIFRGYLQTRIYGLIKSDGLAIIVVAFMFSIMHVPFQMAINNKNALEFVAGNFTLLIFTFFYHIVFNMIQRKYNNIAGNTLFHGFMNWGNSLMV